MMYPTGTGNRAVPAVLEKQLYSSYLSKVTMLPLIISAVKLVQ